MEMQDSVQWLEKLDFQTSLERKSKWLQKQSYKTNNLKKLNFLAEKIILEYWSNIAIVKKNLWAGKH